MKALEALAKKMKTIKNLYSNLLDINHIKSIILLAAKGKKKRREVRKVIENINKYANKILEMLQNNSFYMRPSHNRLIVEKGKERLLTISPFFPNRILDYLIVEALKPYIRKGMYEYCVGNVDKRGIVYGKKVVARHYKRYQYYLKLDIKHFYPSVTSSELIKFLSSKIADKRFLELCKTVVCSSPDMPIGSYYSQWFSNWFLQGLDHHIKEDLGVPFYIRYVDDMLIMGNNKRKLLNAMYNIERWLNERQLSLKRKEQVKLVKQQPIDFLGFRFCENKICLRLRNFKRLNVRLRKVRRTHHISVSQARSLMAYIGWLRQLQLGYVYYINHIQPIIHIGEIRRIISNFERRVNSNGIKENDGHSEQRSPSGECD